MLEWTVHLELAELCLSVSVCTHVGIYCVCVCDYVCACVQVTGPPLLVVSWRDVVYARVRR